MTTIHVNQKDRLATITIDRVKAMNALNQEVLLELRKALLELEGVSVAIITGAGDKAFVAGADIAAMSTMNPLEARAFVELGQGVMQTISEAPFLTIAAVNGFALGGGLELAVSCDLIYAAENAKFGAPETNLGIIPGFGGTVNITERVGMHRAMDLILTGRMISAVEAKNWGLALEVFPAAELMPKVQEIAGKLAKKGLMSLLAGRRLVRQAAAHEKEKSFLLERESFATLFASHEPKEGMKAFLEKREPDFHSPRS